MKLGIIIVIDSIDEELVSSSISQIFENEEKVSFCLVNNNCSDAFSDQLQDLTDQYENADLIHLKKRKSNKWAVRAGSRFMNNHQNLSFLGYVVDLKGNDIVAALQVFLKNQDQFSSQQSRQQKNKLLRQTFFDNIFSVNNYYHQRTLNFDLN